ncbi:MAG: ATP-binding protein [Oligoflexia bacterium]
MIRKALGHSPVVGILGQRQVGKTTLAVSISNDYATLDRTDLLDQATASPLEFLENRKNPFAIDEAQLCPPLFPAVKEWVRMHPRKGQLLLTGSVRFTARKLIRESLTGRIVNLEVLPLSIAEQDGEPLPRHIQELCQVGNEAGLKRWGSRVRVQKPERFHRSLKTGGLPGICFFRDESVRGERFRSHLDTLLNRDIHLVSQTTLSPLQILKAAQHLAENQGTPLSLQSLARAAQTSTQTAKKLLLAFEGIFLIRPIATEGTVSKTSYYFEDQGLATHLCRNPPTFSDDLRRGLYSQLRQEVHYGPGAQNRVFSYRTHDGADVPLVFETQDGLLGVIPSDEREPNLKTLGSARSFMGKYPESKVLIACRAATASSRDFRTFVVPYHWLY